MSNEQSGDGISRFEDLIAWQKARKLTAAVYKISRRDRMAKDFGLTDQIQRASVSIMSNIAEGYERRGQAEFSRFLTIAKASCAETLSLLYVALDAEHIDQSEFEQLRSQAMEVARVIGGLRVAVERRIASNQPKRSHASPP